MLPNLRFPVIPFRQYEFETKLSHFSEGPDTMIITILLRNGSEVWVYDPPMRGDQQGMELPSVSF
jgi:hypothetical protein